MVFDDVAAEYDRSRPTYPDERVDRACQLARLGSADRVLEIGCGSGQLARSLVARGLHVTGLHDVARSYAGDLFSDVQIAAVPTLMQQTAGELNALLRTASFYHRISPSQRHALESESVAIYKRLGRPIRSSTVAVLVTARRRAGGVRCP
jgi:hypothetical protein